MKAVQKVPFYHLYLNNLSSQESLSFCRNCFNACRTRTLFFLNAHCFNISKHDGEYLEALNESDLLLNDGVGIKLASVLAGIDLKENMNGTDFIPKLLELSAAKDKSVYLLGAKPGVAAVARKNLQATHRGLNICGIDSGYFTETEEEEVVARINESRAEVIVVGMGVPFQEKWITRNRGRFPYAKIIVAGGAIIDFSAGRVRRAPRLIQTLGLEWLFRFLQEPKRLFKRYFLGNWLFLRYITTARFRPK